MCVCVSENVCVCVCVWVCVSVCKCVFERMFVVYVCACVFVYVQGRFALSCFMYKYVYECVTCG